MAGSNLLVAASITPKVLVSAQLGTSDAAVYTVPAAQSVKLATGSLCNVTSVLVPGSVAAAAAVAGISAPTITLGTTATTGGTFAAATYYWKVTATTAAFGQTAGSNEISAAIAANGTQVINWTAITNATGFKVYRGTAAGAENVLVATLGSVTTYTDTGTAGTSVTVPTTNASGTFYWKITAKNGSGESMPSAEVSATVTAVQAEPLSWAAVPTATSYNVYRGTSAGSENVLVANVTTTSYTDVGAAGSTASPPAASTFATAVTVYVSLVQSGGAVDATHRIISGFSLVANDTLSLRDYVDGAMLGPGDVIAAYAGTATAVDLVLTGTVHS